MKRNLFIISGPSGAGEDTIMKALQEKKDFKKVVTTTTRAMRKNETEGDPYYFLSKEEFKDGISDGRFFEYVIEDNGNYYGNTYEEIERVRKSDDRFLMKLEYKGVITYKEIFPEAVSIMIDAPWEELEGRIRKRDKVSEAFVQGRADYAKGWYQNKDKFDHIVENRNGQLEEAIQNTLDIINSY
ncbi:guanylate kinase [Candidatus Parcubacteria bacterium]|nr:MAG: guanylate kinase [Candidatus Parcubacteria bacterium]